MTTNQPTPQPAATVPKTGLWFLAEYRSGSLDVFHMDSKGDRPALHIIRAVHRVEIGEKAYEFSEVLPPTTVESQWTPPAKKGQPVTVELHIEQAEVLQTGRDGKQRTARGLWRIRVLTIQPVAKA